MKEDIRKGIQSLKYDPNTILSFTGDAVENVNLTEDMIENGEYVVVTRKTVNAASKDYEIEVANANNSVAYAGALLLANEGLVNSTPQGLFYAEREPITLAIDLPGMGSKKFKGIEASYSGVLQAVNQMTEEWFQKNPNAHQPANCSYSSVKAYSEDQLRVAVGFDLGKKLNLNLNTMSSESKQVFVLTFKQIFYTVSLDVPSKAEDFFTNNETWDNIVSQNGVNDKNPPVYVGSVAYGRMIYVAVETNNMSQEIETKIGLMISGNKLTIDESTKKLFKGSRFTVFALGGDAEAHSAFVTEDLEDIKKMITENSVFTRSNPGSPIAYSTRFLKDNVFAVINNAASYVEVVRKAYKSGSLRLEQKGGYVAKFYVTWKEQYYENGVKKMKPCEWEKNGQGLTSGFNTVIPLPGNTVDLHVKVTENTGLAWEGWRTFVDENLPLTPDLRVSVWGTTLSPKSEVVTKP